MKNINILYIIGAGLIVYAGYTIYMNNSSQNMQANTVPPKPLSGQAAITPPQSLGTAITSQVTSTANNINSSIQGFFNNNNL